MPGRGKVKPSHLREGFWLREVSTQYNRADIMSRLSKASLALRGIDNPGALEELQRRCASGDSAAISEAVIVARDFQLQGLNAVVKLQTSRITSVLAAFIGNKFAQQPEALVRYPILFTLMRKSGRNFTEAFADSGPPGPLTMPEEVTTSDVATLIDLPALRKWNEARQVAVSRQVKIIAELTSEAATSLLVAEKAEALELISTAEAFYRAECPLAEKQSALTIFRNTAERLR